MNVLAMVGLAIVAIGTMASLADSINFFRGIDIGFGGGYGIAAFLGVGGTLFALIGGTIARPKYYPVAAIILGVIYLASFSGYLIHFKPELHWELLASLAPGILLVIQGLALFITSKRLKKPASPPITG